MTIIQAARAVAARALDVALPANCVGCGAEGPPICARCEPALDARMRSPAGVPIGLPEELPEPLLQLEWCAPFHGVTRDALHAVKYAGEQRLAEPLGRAVARRWAKAGVGAELITNVPVHEARYRTRGYDQAELIARHAARELGMPFASLLRRSRATIAQFDLDRRDRARNVRGAFEVAPHEPGACPRPLGPAYRRRRHDRIDARCVRHRAPRRRRDRRVSRDGRQGALTSAGRDPGLYSEDDPRARR